MKQLKENHYKNSSIYSLILIDPYYSSDNNNSEQLNDYINKLLESTHDIDAEHIIIVKLVNNNSKQQWQCWQTLLPENQLKLKQVQNLSDLEVNI